jgi:hypothetical protein
MLAWPSAAECVCSLEEYVYVVEQNNSNSRDLLVIKTDDWSNYRFKTYVNTDGWK